MNFLDRQIIDITCKAQREFAVVEHFRITQYNIYALRFGVNPICKKLRDIHTQAKAWSIKVVSEDDAVRNRNWITINRSRERTEG